MRVISNGIRVSIRIAHIVLGIILLYSLAGCKNLPQSEGLFLVNGDAFQETTYFSGPLSPDQLHSILEIPNNNPVFFLHFPEIEVKDLTLFLIANENQKIVFRLSSISENYEITFKEPLQPGIYCLIYENRLISNEPAQNWCFSIGEIGVDHTFISADPASRPTFIQDTHVSLIEGLAEEYRLHFESRPVPPDDLGDPPDEPEFPPLPVEPSDQTDTVAIAAYLAALQEYQTIVEEIQQTYKDQVLNYQIEADRYAEAFQQYGSAWEVWAATRETAYSELQYTLMELEAQVGKHGLTWLLLQQDFFIETTGAWVTMDYFFDPSEMMINESLNIAKNPVEFGARILLIDYSEQDLLLWFSTD